MRESLGLTVGTDVKKAPHVESRKTRALLLRLTRELLFNVVKHAEVDRARLEARAKDGRLRLTVKDESVGSGPAHLEEGQGGLGLSDMRERLEVLGGRLNLTAAPGEGVEVKVAVLNTASGEAAVVPHPQRAARGVFQKRERSRIR